MATKIEDTEKDFCDICLKKFKSNTSLRRHMSIHIEEELNCTKCSKLCRNKIQLYRHMHSVHNEQLHQCQTCSKTYSAKKNLKAHQLSHQDKILEDCTICFKKYRPQYVKIHEKICRKKYLNSIETHYIARKASKSVQLYPCDQCDKIFYQKIVFDTHNKRLHEESIQCSICNKILKYLDLSCD